VKNLGISSRWILESILLLLSFAISPIILGILIDRRLNTFPVTTLVMMLLGLNLGIVMICRRVAAIYMQIAPPDPIAQVGESPLSSPQNLVPGREGNSQPLGGDSC
jgi:hypothetical protein